MIKFASHVIEVGKVFPKSERPKFVKVAERLDRPNSIKNLAAMMHDEYVQNMLKSELYAGQENPQRMRDDKTGSGEQINILQPFENLTPGWQKENLDAAEVVYDLVEPYRDNLDQVDADMEMLADKVHQAWSERNSYSELSKIDYADLPEEEKEKDRHQVELAKDFFRSNPKRDPNAYGKSGIILDENDRPAYKTNDPMSNFMIQSQINDIIVTSAGEYFGKTPEQTKREIKERTGMDVSLEYIRERQNSIRDKK
jgi:hypothetical protein